MADDYQEFTAPTRDPKTGKPLSMPQRRAYKKAIEERENFAARAKRDLPRVSEFLRETVGGVKKSAKEMGKEAFKEAEGLRELGTTVGPVVKEAAEDVVLAGPRAKAAVYSDPEGAKEFGRAVVSGDRPAIRTLSEEVSKSAVEPFATAADATLGGLAAEEGKYGEAALYGGLLLLPATLQTLGGKLSKGWLKKAAEAGEEIPDEAAKKMDDLAKRVDEGKVTDDMQIRRELAGIEDAHKAEYMQSKPPGGGAVSGRSAGLLEAQARVPEIENKLGSIEDRLYELRTQRENLSGADVRKSLEEEDILRRQRMDLRRELRDIAPQRSSRSYGERESARRGRMARKGLTLEGEPLTGVKKDLMDMYGAGSRRGPESFRQHQLARTERMGLAGGDPKLASPKFGLKDQGHHNVVEDLGPLLPEDRDLLGRFADDYNLTEAESRQLRDEYVAYGYDDFPGRSARGFEEIPVEDAGALVRGGKPPGGGGSDPIPEFDYGFELDPEFVPEPEPKWHHSSYATNMVMANEYRDRVKRAHEIFKQAKHGESGLFAGLPVKDYDDTTQRMLKFLTEDTGPETADAIMYIDELYGTGKISREQAIKEYGVIAKQKQYDDWVDPDAHPNIERPETLYDRAKAGGGKPPGSGDAELDKLMSVTSPSGLRMDQFQREVMDLPDSQFKDVLLEDIDEVMSLPDDFFDQPGIGTREESLSGIMELYEMQKQQGFPAIKSPVADADISIPSFEDLQRKLRNRDFSQRASKSMVDIEKAKEIMRRRLINDPSFHGRVAEAKQGQQLARSRVRGSRTPGTPSASGKIPEGTSRAEPKGPRRERPKKKDE
tara:strand:+ start:419 stop:2911 length:2493 start_codon:yes stop_codon:yes gene_type:complete